MRGLVVGKFCPLHRGHEFLITQALAQCHHLTVISYTVPGFPGFEENRRQAWLARLFPQVQVFVIDQERLKQLCTSARLVEAPCIPHDSAPDEDHRRFVGWLIRDLLKTYVDAVFTSEDYGDGFARTLAKYFGQSVAHVCVDKARTHVPVSGTLIRSNPYLYRQYISQDVYVSLIRRIAILGGESSGKTTLATALANRLNTKWVPEYGRELWEARSGRLQISDMLDIARIQVEREKKSAIAADKWIVCDTTPLTTKLYCENCFNCVPNDLESLSKRRYDFTILCAPDFPFVQDGTRQDNDYRLKQHAWYEARLKDSSTDYHLASGTLENRLSAILTLLHNL